MSETPRNEVTTDTRSREQFYDATVPATPPVEEAPADDYEPVVREYPHGFFAGARKLGAARPGSLCRHAHQSRESAEACAARQVEERRPPAARLPVEEAPDRDTLLAERRTLEHAPYSDLAAMRLRELDDLLATPPVAPRPLSNNDLVDAVALWLCTNHEDEEGVGCEPEAGPPCLGHVEEAGERLTAARPVSGDVEGLLRRMQDALDDWYDERRWEDCEHNAKVLDAPCWRCRMTAVLAVVRPLLDQAAEDRAEVGAVERLFRWHECHENVTRGGEEQPCEKPAVALRRDPQEGNRYPVCGHHARANDPLMVSLAEIAALASTTERSDDEGTDRG